MYIKQLEVDNFKSFANKVEIPMLKGFTTISGPNGSGKSNIIDSILFALGLSTSRTLRAEKLFHLISTYNKRNEAFVKVTFAEAGDDGEFSVARRIRKSSQGFNSSSMIVRYWTKNRSNGSFQSNTLNVSNGSYSIYIAQNYSDYYISITGITRDSYNISQPSGNGFNFYSSISNNQTYGNTYSFSITVDADHGWYCSNGNNDTDDFGSPVVSYSVNGSPVTTSLTATGSSSVGGSSSNITFTYEFVVTGITQLYVSGLAQKTYTVYVIYVDLALLYLLNMYEYTIHIQHLLHMPTQVETLNLLLLFLSF